MSALEPVEDRYSRPLRDLRISVTDRCNFRCPYCMPRDLFGSTFRFLPRAEILTFEEIFRLATIFQGLGARKIRLTGGEPLLRKDLSELVRLLAALPGLDLALTSNGSLLPQQAQLLADAGLQRVTVSLDSLEDSVFRAMNDVSFPVSRVVAGIEAAEAAGLRPVKINTMVQRGVNDHTVVDLARHFKGSGHIVRFIEYMDVGTANGWRLDDVVPGREIVARIGAAMPLDPLRSEYRGAVAQRWRYRDGDGEIGVITSVSRPFCADCTRVRLSAKGELFTCLFAGEGTDLRRPLRSGWSDEAISQLVATAWARREDRYSERRSQRTPGLGRVEMSYIGG